MKAQASKFPYLLAWVAAISLIVLCGAAVAAMMGWIPTSLGKPEAPILTKLEQPAAPAPDQRDRAGQAPAPVAAAARCSECGVVQSVREVTANVSFEITVQLDDGTNLMFTEASAPSWRNGDKVRIVNGVIQSDA